MNGGAFRTIEHIFAIKRSGFGDAIDALTENPLPITLVVRPAGGFDTPDGVRSLSAELGELEEADVVQIDTEWVQRFHAILEIVRYAVLVTGMASG